MKKIFNLLKFSFLAVPFLALADGDGMMMGGWGMGWGMGVAGWFFGITWLVWLIVEILAAVWLWQQINKKL